MVSDNSIKGSKCLVYNVSRFTSWDIHIAAVIVAVPGDIHIYIRRWDKQKIWERPAKPISFQIWSPLQWYACPVNYVRDNDGALNYNQISLPSLVSETDKWMNLPIPIFAFIQPFLCQLQPLLPIDGELNWSNKRIQDLISLMAEDPSSWQKDGPLRRLHTSSRGSWGSDKCVWSINLWYRPNRSICRSRHCWWVSGGILG